MANRNSLNRQLSEKEYNLSCGTVRKNHSFFWRTNLSFERMCQISEWLGSLTEDQKKMVEELCKDAREDENFEANCE